MRDDICTSEASRLIAPFTTSFLSGVGSCICLPCDLGLPIRPNGHRKDKIGSEPSRKRLAWETEARENSCHKRLIIILLPKSNDKQATNTYEKTGPKKFVPSPYGSNACGGELNKGQGDDSETAAGERGVRAATGREMSATKREGGRKRSHRYRASSFFPASPVSAALVAAAGVAASRSCRELHV